MDLDFSHDGVGTWWGLHNQAFATARDTSTIFAPRAATNIPEDEDWRRGHGCGPCYRNRTNTPGALFLHNRDAIGRLKYLRAWKNALFAHIDLMIRMSRMRREFQIMLQRWVHEEQEMAGYLPLVRAWRAMAVDVVDDVHELSEAEQAERLIVARRERFMRYFELVAACEWKLMESKGHIIDEAVSVLVSLGPSLYRGAGYLLGGWLIVRAYSSGQLT